MIPAGPSDRRHPADGIAGSRRSTASRIAWPALAFAVGILAAVVATTAVSGGSSAVLVARAAVLVLLVLAVAAVLGVLAVVLLALPDGDPRRGRLLDVAAGAAALWAVAAAVTAFLLYLGDAPPAGSAAFGPGLVSFVADVGTGRTWLIAAVLAAVLSALLVAVRSVPGVALLPVLTAIAAVPIALQSAMPGESIGSARTVVAAGLVQLLALSTWTGALAVGGAIGAVRGHRPAVWCFLAVLVALGAAWPVLRADGAVSPLALAGAGTVGLAGLLALLAARARGARRPAVHGLQLLLLAVSVGLAVAASVTRVAMDVPDRTTPAEILTGAPLPPMPTLAVLMGTWQPDPLWLVLCGALLAGYGRLVLRAGGWTALRWCSWITGVLLLAWLTSGGPAAYEELLLGAHLLQHLALVLIVPLLLAGGAPGRLLAAAEDPGRPRRGAPVATGGSHALLAVTRPVPAAIVAAGALAALYGSGALGWSVGDVVGTEVTTTACVLVGALLVRAMTAPGAPRRSTVVVAGALLVAEVGGGVALALGSALLLPDWFGAMGWGTDALAAQRSAALGAVLVAAAPTLLLLIRALRAAGSAPSSLARPDAVAA